MFTLSLQLGSCDLIILPRTLGGRGDCLRPQQLVRSNGTPNVYSADFSTNSGEGKLIILNGDETGDNRISSAEIQLNGSVILGTENFNQNVYRQEAPVTLTQTNQLEIRLSSKPGSYLTVLVTREILLSITITSPADGSQVPASLATVTGRVESGASYVEVNVNGTHALVNGSNFLAPDVDLNPGTNVLKAIAVDSLGNKTSTTTTVTYTETTSGWIETQLSNEGGFAPLEAQFTIIPHIQGTLNWETAAIEFNGPATPTVDRMKDDEYSLVFSEPGFYVLTFNIQDAESNNYAAQKHILVLRALTAGDWSIMNQGVQQLEDSFQSLLSTMDVNSARQKVLNQAKTNPEFSSALLSSDSLCLVFRGLIPIIIDLPDPAAKPID